MRPACQPPCNFDVVPCNIGLLCKRWGESARRLQRGRACSPWRVQEKGKKAVVTTAVINGGGSSAVGFVAGNGSQDNSQVLACPGPTCLLRRAGCVQDMTAATAEPSCPPQHALASVTALPACRVPELLQALHLVNRGLLQSVITGG